MESIEKQTPVRVVALGSMVVILTGSFLLMLPVCMKPGINLHCVGTLFTSASAVCVTGPIAVDTVDMHVALGQAIVAFLMQVGDLRVIPVGVGVILILGRKVDLKGRLLIKGATNPDSGERIAYIVKNVLKTTLRFEGAGIIPSYLVSSRSYPPLKALGVSLFHSVAVPNNSDFDIPGGLQNLTEYGDNILLGLTTSDLIIFGGLGFLVIMDIAGERSFKRLCLHSKAVIVTVPILLAVRTVPPWFAEDIIWLDAFFTNISARTAGFTTFLLSDFTTAGPLTVTVLMLIDASLESTGGEVKTNTLFILFHIIKGATANIRPHTFHYKIPQEILYKAAIVTALSSLVVISDILYMCALEPGPPSEGIVLKIISTSDAVGLPTGITPELNPLSELLEVLIMCIERLGSLTIVTTWVFKPDTSVSFSEGSISIR